MNIFTSIGGFFKNLFTHEQSWEKAASLTLTVISPLLTTLLSLTAGPGVSSAVSGVISQIQNDLKTVNDVVVGAGDAPTAETALNSILTNLQEIENSAEIKNSANQKAVS